MSIDSLTKEQFVRVAQFLAPSGDPRPDARPGEPRPEGRPREPRPGAPGFRPPLVAALDADGDGELSAGEIEAAAKALLKLDRNGDGKLTPDELGPPPPRDGRPGEGRPAGRAPGDGRSTPAGLGERSRASDTNGDGKLSREEAPERLRPVFDRFDENGDGFLDGAELSRRLPDGELRPERGRPEGSRPNRDRPADPKPE
jgi:collagen type III alpha